MPPVFAGILGAVLALVAVALVFLGIWGVRRRRERALAAQPRGIDATLGDVVSALPIGVAILGLHDNLLAANETARSIGAVKGTRIGFQTLMSRVRMVRMAGEPFAGDVEREHIPGQAKLQLRCQITPLDDELILVVAVDDAQQRRVDAVRRDFVANISHELKTPIGAISVLAEAVEAAKDQPDAVERFAGKLLHETARLSELVRQVIELSRLQAEDPGFAREQVELAEVIEDATGRVREQAQQRAASIAVVQQAAGTVVGDRWQLSDALTNLLLNALHYSEEGARVTVSVQDSLDPDGHAVVDTKVSDNGIGIRREDQERIFERFYRVDYGRSRSMGGTGLGLAIVRHIAELHGGSISVWSKLGQGSTFTLRLPAHNHEGDA